MKTGREDVSRISAPMSVTPRPGLVMPAVDGLLADRQQTTTAAPRWRR